ncbi:hypothetical protein A7X87_04065 [Stenotrophomonas maltophilia]|uniref:hypothetical protein n=1 Tax=Stenotrophomonas maltophilia TaxID=40324 RepID=UPI000DA75CB4|nr:hypothetical protein [Stenotrophomonas maltophilia]PZT08811.1 hypothetical protein A7X87_04065 [Stenotrophomonas maltophilia]
MSTGTDLGPESFTAETTLWQIYWKSMRIKPSLFNVVSTLLVFGFLVATTFWAPQNLQALAGTVRELASFSLNATLAVLGFLVAGFTIFATVTNPNMFIAMGSIRHEESGLSWLKHSFFVLLRTFVYYLVYAVLCFAVVYFGAKGGPVSFLVSLSPHPEAYALCIAKAAFVALATGQFFLLMQLKSFIYNVYSSVVASLRWRAEGHD